MPPRTEHLIVGLGVLAVVLAAEVSCHGPQVHAASSGGAVPRPVAASVGPVVTAIIVDGATARAIPGAVLYADAPADAAGWIYPMPVEWARVPSPVAADWDLCAAASGYVTRCQAIVLTTGDTQAFFPLQLGPRP